MDGFLHRNQPFGPLQFGVAFFASTQRVPAAVQQPRTPQLPPNGVVQGLRHELFSAVNEIKSLKEKNKSLQEKVDLLEEVRHLQEEVKEKDGLLKRATRRRRARTKAHGCTCTHLLEKEEACRSKAGQADEMKLSHLQLTSRSNEQEVKEARRERDGVKQKEEEGEERERQRKGEKECCRWRQKLKTRWRKTGKEQDGDAEGRAERSGVSS